jgi:hypothetical protein
MVLPPMSRLLPTPNVLRHQDRGGADLHLSDLPFNRVARTSALRSSEKFIREKLESRLTSTSEGLQDVLGTAVFALWQPLAQLADDQAGNPVALEPHEQFVLAGGELYALQVPTDLGR